MFRNIAGSDIVIIGQQPWDTEIGSNCKDMALEMSKRNRILYVNSPLDRITRLRHRYDYKVKKGLRYYKEKRVVWSKLMTICGICILIAC